MTRLRGIACAAALMLGCGPSINLADRPRFNNGSNHLTLAIYDAFTGAAIEGATVRMQVGPYLMEASSEGNLYNLSQIPQGTFPISIERADYLGFQGVADPTVLTSNAQLNGPSSMVFQTRSVLLYPERMVASDVTVRVFEKENGAAVASGTVIAQLVTAGTNFVAFTGGTQLSGSVTLRPSVMVGQIGAGGTAVLAKDQLILGAQYRIGTYGAVDAANRFLSPLTNITHTVSTDFPQINLFLGPPATTPVALSATNETGGEQPVLSVVFPYPIEVCSNAASHSWSTSSADTNLNGVRAKPASANPVTVGINSGTLTLTPEFGVGFDAFDPGDNLSITFSGIQVKVVGASGCTSLGSVKLRDSASNVSATYTHNIP
jgi:hypothetical protein